MKLDYEETITVGWVNSVGLVKEKESSVSADWSKKKLKAKAGITSFDKVRPDLVCWLLCAIGQMPFPSFFGYYTPAASVCGWYVLADKVWEERQRRRSCSSLMPDRFQLTVDKFDRMRCPPAYLSSIQSPRHQGFWWKGKWESASGPAGHQVVQRQARLLSSFSFNCCLFSDSKRQH